MEIDWVLDLAPRYMWVVGPGSIDPTLYVFAVEVTDINATFARLNATPPPPL